MSSPSSSSSDFSCITNSSYPKDQKFETKYCSLCDAYFQSKAQLRSHINANSIHPRCATCKRSYLNKNSLRNHYVFSSKHFYCRPCDKHFESAAGLAVHIKYSIAHSDDSDDEGEEDTRPSGWEDEYARQLETEQRRNQIEEIIHVDAEEASRLSMVQRRVAMMKFMARRPRNNQSPDKRYSYSCPICLSCPKTVSATRCGHLFCTPCIKRAVECNGVCPTCRTEAVTAQIREIDLGVY